MGGKLPAGFVFAGDDGPGRFRSRGLLAIAEKTGMASRKATEGDT